MKPNICGAGIVISLIFGTCIVVAQAADNGDVLRRRLDKTMNKASLYRSLISADKRRASKVQSLLENAGVATPRAAKKASSGLLFKTGPRADQSMEVLDLFETAGEIPEFCKAGDLLWRVVVRSDGGSGGIVGETWINASSGKEHLIFAGVR